MSDALNVRVNKFDFANADQTDVVVDVDLSSTPPGSADIVFLYIAVGAEEPVLVSQGRKGHLETKINIAKTRGLVGGGPGTKPVSLMAYACWVYNQGQAVNWIKANAAVAAQAATIYLR